MPAPPAIRPGHHPFPFLLYLEWILLGLAVTSELMPALLLRTTVLPIVTLTALFGFGLLGTWLPTGSKLARVLHVTGQFGLILLTSRVGLAGLRLFPLLYIIVVIRSCLLFRLRGRIVIVGLAFVLFASMVQIRVRSLSSQLPDRLGRRLFPLLAGIRINLVLLFAILLVFVLLLMSALLAERERREELRIANQQLQESAARLKKLAMAEERSRIARDIHDALGHALTGLNIQLEGALKLWERDPEKALNFLREAKKMGSTALQETRLAVSTLRAPPLSQPSLEASLQELAEHCQTMTGLLPQITIAGPSPPAALQSTVYRIVQEALTNTCKYAHATAVSVVIRTDSSLPQPGLHLMVQDNGQGFNPRENETGFGIKGMQERAEASGGTFQLTSRPGNGCTIQVWLPLPWETR